MNACHRLLSSSSSHVLQKFKFNAGIILDEFLFLIKLIATHQHSTWNIDSFCVCVDCAGLIHFSSHFFWLIIFIICTEQMCLVFINGFDSKTKTSSLIYFCYNFFATLSQVNPLNRFEGVRCKHWPRLWNFMQNLTQTPPQKSRTRSIDCQPR